MLLRCHILWPFAICFLWSSLGASSTQNNIIGVNHSNLSELTGNPFSTYNIQEALFPGLYSPLEEYSNVGQGTYIFGPDNYMFIDACYQAGGLRNCTSSCSNPTTMFGDLQTLHNCMVYATVAFHYANNNLTERGRQIVEELGIMGNNTKPSDSAVTDQLQTCLVDYCSDNVVGCKESFVDDRHRTWDGYPDPYENTTFWDFNRDGMNLVNAICAYSSSPVDPDVGGIGVYVSYWIQTGISLLGFSATLMWKSLLFHTHRGFLALGLGFKKANERAGRAQPRHKTHLSRLAVALTDFHKAQCFFMLTVNIAAQVVIRKGGLQPQSLQQIYNTYFFIKVLAINGFLPITFTLFNLHLIDMVSWYLLMLSVSSVVLSVATFMSIGDFNPNQADLKDLYSASTSGGPKSCGNVQPGAFCYQSVEVFSEPSYSYGETTDDMSGGVANVGFGILAVCLAMLALLIADKCKIWQRPATRRLMICLWDILNVSLKSTNSYLRYVATTCNCASVQLIYRRTFGQCASIGRDVIFHTRILYYTISTTRTFRRCTSAIFRVPARWKQTDRYILFKILILRYCTGIMLAITEFCLTTNYTVLLQQLFVAAVYITFSGLYFYCFSAFSQNLALFATRRIYSTTWNFGQIVAITVWAPPLIEYLHLELRGMKRGFEHKLLPPYRITKIIDPGGYGHTVKARRGSSVDGHGNTNNEHSDYGRLLPLHQTTKLEGPSEEETDRASQFPDSAEIGVGDSIETK